MLYNIAVIDVKNAKGRNDYYNGKVYELYRSMIQRCYSPLYLQKHPTYKNCKVCERWLTYSNFIEDLPKIEGYQDWLIYINQHHSKRTTKTVVLDKDIKSAGEKIYSLETCKFMTLGDSSKELNTRSARERTGQFSREAVKKRVANTDFSKFFAEQRKFAMSYAKSVIAIKQDTGERFIFESIHAAARWAGVDKMSIKRLIQNGHFSKTGFSYCFAENGSTGA